MKKGVLILLGFLIVSSVEAKNDENLPNRFRVNYYAYNNAVNFFEHGIEFFVFTNGDFDFDAKFNNRRVRIDRDFRGRIRRIGNVSLNYDFKGNISRIGNIRMNYFRDRLTNVGNLNIEYDRWGTPIFYGNVRNYYFNNGVRFNINFGDVCDYNDAYFYRNDFGRNYSQFREDRNFYYYRANPNAKIGKRSQILRRRKLTNTVRNSNTRRNNVNNRISSNRISNNSYRKNKVNRSTNNSIRAIDDKNKIKRSLNIIGKKTDSKRKTIKRSDIKLDRNKKIKFR